MPRDRKREAEYQRVRNQRKRRELLTLLGGKCAHCGFDDERALQIDHVDGGGHQHRAGRGSSVVYHEMLLAVRAGHRNRYQVLCANCNWIKRVENQEYGNTLSHEATGTNRQLA